MEQSYPSLGDQNSVTKFLGPSHPYDDVLERWESAPDLPFDERLHNLIVQHITDTGILALRSMLAPIAETLDCRDVLVAEAGMLLGQVTKDDEQTVAEDKLIFDIITKTIARVKNAKGKERQQDDLLTDIIIGLNETNVISSHSSLLLMISSIDSRMIVPLSAKKINFIKERVSTVNYKIVKDVVKTAFQELNNLALVITEKALSDFRPFEEVLLEILDRKNNLSPLLLVQHDILKVNQNHPANIMRRVADKAREIERSFRPLATISELIGKPYLFPTFAHPLLTSMIHWKEDYKKIHLPLSTSNQCPQTFFQYTMLKQPWYLVRLEYKEVLKERIPQTCTEVLLILILEAMAAMEETDLPIEHPLNQFNWQHLNYVGVVCWSEAFVSFESLLGRLHSQLTELKYRKARGELMRLVLQYVALVQPQSNDTAQPDGLGFYSKLRDLYNLLYPEDRVDTNVATGTECLKLVRYFAPAAIWLNFEALKNAKNSFATDPPVNLHRHITIIKEILDSDKNSEDGFSTVLANAYTRNSDVFKKKFCANILFKLEKAKPGYVLPYGRKAFKGETALNVAFLESLNFSASKELMIYLWNQINDHLIKDMLPCPALVESLARISFVGEINGCLGFMVDKFLTAYKECREKFTDGKDPQYLVLMVLLEYFSTRVKVLFSPHFYVYFYCLYDLFRQFMDEVGCISHQMYSATESMFAKWFLWNPPLLFIQCTQASVQMGLRRGGETFTLVKESKLFKTGETYSSPELIKLYLIQAFKTNKLIFHKQKPSNDFFYNYLVEALKFHPLPESTAKWIPSCFNPKICEGTDNNYIQQIIHASYQDVEAFANCDEMSINQMIRSRKPTLFLALFRILYEDIKSSRPMNFPNFAYDMLKGISMRYLILSANALSEYILYLMKQAKNNQGSVQRLCHTVNEFIFTYQFMTFDRFLFQFLLHPNDDESIRNGLEFIQCLVTDNHHLDQRFKALHDFLPLWSQMSFCDSNEFFTGMREYYKAFPEYTYLELSKNGHGEMEYQVPQDHMPVYYSNLLEKLLPIVEFLFFRLIEMDMPPEVATPIMDRFVCVFKYHPQPATFLYKTLYCFPPEQIRHDWVRKYVRQIALLDREHKYYLLSDCFIDRYEGSTPAEICKTLIDRIKKSTTYKHQPPQFCSRDWRFAELPPGAATLVGADIELMISKFEPKVLVTALVNCGFKRPLEKPFEAMNAIGLILTTLPEAFQQCFVDTCETFIDLPELTEEDDPSLLLHSFSVDGYLAADNDPLTALAIIHSYTQHCSSTGLLWLFGMIENMHSKVRTEAQLMLLIRIIVPLLMREIDSKKKLQLSIYICNAIMALVRNKTELDFCDTYCDLLYEIKYVFQLSDREKMDELIQNFPSPLKEKMKFFFSSKEERLQNQKLKAREEKLHQQMSQQQLLRHPALQHQPSLPNLQPPSSQMSVHNPLASGLQLPEHLRTGVSPGPLRMPTPMDVDPVQIREKIEPEMVAPAVRADSLPEMAYPQNIIRPPGMDSGMYHPGMMHPSMMSQNMQQHHLQQQQRQQQEQRSNMAHMRQPLMMPSSVSNSMGMNMSPHPQGMPPMNSMARFQSMGPPGQMNPMMGQQMPTQGGYMPPNSSNMQPQGNFVPNQGMFMPPNSGIGNQPPYTSSDGGGSHYGMMGPGQQMPMSMPNQGGLIQHNQGGMMQHPSMMAQGGMQPPPGHMMNPGMHPQQNYQYHPNMRPNMNMPPYNMPPHSMPPR